MAYPKIDLPMYEPLKAISIELFLPNINLIAPNSITLIETNQSFIESYMVGLNHEFARKLLVARLSHRPARQLLPPVLGRARLHRQRRPERGSAQGEALRHPGAPPLGAGLRSSATHNNRAAARPAADAAGRAGHPRRAAQEISDGGDLCPARAVAAQSGRHDRLHQAAPARPAEHAGRGAEPAASARSAARSTRPRPIPTSTSSASI